MLNQYKKVIAVGLTILLCLTTLQLSVLAQENSTQVEAINWSNFDDPYPTTTNATLLKNILSNATKYAVTTWYNSAKDYDAQSSSYLNFGGTNEQALRPPAQESFVLAVALKTDIYDAPYTGVSDHDAKNITLKLARSVAFRHKANTNNGWGHGWQTGLWANYAGFAAWLMWDDLNTVDREYVRKMIESEANNLLTKVVPYYKSINGEILSPGDTKAEENAWNGALLAFASVMMPNHPNRTNWTKKYLEYVISASSRPSDISNQQLYHGKAISEWLNGSNMHENATVENHHLLHPDYMCFINNSIEPALFYTLSNKQTPKGSFFNANLVYDALVDLPFSSPPYNQPGGTIYVDNSSDIYYPEGSDWGTSRRMNFLNIDVMADQFKLDDLVNEKASEWIDYHANYVLAQQNRHTDGRIYANSTENSFHAREEEGARLAAMSCLSYFIMNQKDNLNAPLFSVTNEDMGMWTQEDNFSDSFENGFSNWITLYGTPSTTSLSSVSGNNSYIIDEEKDVISHIFSDELNKKVELWIYDDKPTTNVIAIGNVKDSFNASIMGIHDGLSTDYYVYRIGSNWYISNKLRSNGWHKLTWDFTSGSDLKMYIDDTLINTTTALTSFNTIKIGDFWQGVGSPVYFDDLKVLD